MKIIIIIIIKDNILEENEQTISNCFGNKRSVLESEFIKSVPRCLIWLNNLTSMPTNLLNLSNRWIPLLLLTHKTIRNPTHWHSFWQWPKLQTGQATLFLFWVECGSVGRWRGANEELMSLQLANCQPQDARIKAFVCISPGQRREGLGEPNSWLNNLTHIGSCVPFLR